MSETRYATAPEPEENRQLQRNAELQAQVEKSAATASGATTQGDIEAYAERRRMHEKRQTTRGVAIDPYHAQEREQAEAANLLTYCLERTRAFADAAADELMSIIRSKSSELDFENIRELMRTRIADIEENCVSLHQQVKRSRARGDGFLVCAKRARGYIPVSRQEEALVVDDSKFEFPTAEREYFTVETEKALDFVEPELADFLHRRVATSEYVSLAQRMGMAGGTGAAPPNTFQIMVNSPSAGARVSYSPCYFVNYTVLASPTSPVYGYIPPGRYIFMVTTKAHLKHSDPGEFDIPPSGIQQPIDLTV